MIILLDTHCWLWMLTEPEQLSEDVHRLVVNRQNELLISAASSWEIAIKYSLGKLPLPEPPTSYIPSRIKQSGVGSLSITHTHALRAGELPAHHRDPFDRLLVAQAQTESIPLLTADRKLEPYDIEIIWAR